LEPKAARDLPQRVATITSHLEAITAPLAAKPAVATISTDALLDYNTEDDPGTLLGHRWLGKGGSCLIVGQTGIGKSSFCSQAAISWGLGNDLFGITPVRPLKSLIIQAENDIGDLSEIFKGVVSGMGVGQRRDELRERLVFMTDAGHSGQAFLDFIRPVIIEHAPDLVWIDPLLSFIGGNISEQETASKFLRGGLGAIAQETGICWMVMHHTNKPPKEAPQGGQGARAAGDYSYLGTGSSELANWARAVLVLREMASLDRVFELRAAKRGQRAGMTDSAGKPVTEAFLRHATEGIHWVRALTPETDASRVMRTEAEDIVRNMPRGQAISYRGMRDIAQKVLELKTPKSFSMPKSRAYRVLELAMRMASVPGQSEWFVNNNAPVNGNKVTSGNSTVTTNSVTDTDCHGNKVTTPLKGGVTGCYRSVDQSGVENEVTVTSDDESEDRELRRGLPP
jgi:hypothetical protein